MKQETDRSSFFYRLPEELIAQTPLPERAQSRLLCVDRHTGRLCDSRMARFTEYLRPGDLLVFNDTRVVPARLYAQKDTGGRVEILLERMLDEQRMLVQLKAGKAPKPGTVLHLSAADRLCVVSRRQRFFVLEAQDRRPLAPLFAEYGHMPLPPYIKRQDTDIDAERYQTVYAREAGAVAAPTAGLHFSRELLERIAAMGVEQAFVTLHVGSGTFLPVREQDIRRHEMHPEVYKVPPQVCERIAETRARGGRVIAVGTTVVRTLESMQQTGRTSGETRIFIYPGYRFSVVDALLTNFHLPESTLLMLVCAFGGIHNILPAYAHAVAQRYRFFSYGDAMFIAGDLN